MHERAGTPARPEDLVDLDALTQAYYEFSPNPEQPHERVSFGTSGHRGTSLNRSFNDAHIAAISAAIAEYRADSGIRGPLFIGADTHPLSAPALTTALEVFAAAGARVYASEDDALVPTPALSHAILTHNRARGRDGDLADGVIITPSHNPPQDGGIKYNPPHGGPADSDITQRIASRANEILENGEIVPRNTTPSPERFDFMTPYVAALPDVVNLEAIRNADLTLAAHPLSGAATHYWEQIARVHGLNLTVLGPGIDPTWSFMTLDWDGNIRMDPSSHHAMQTVLEEHERFDLVFANDADADRFGIVTREGGLQQPNHVLAVAIDHLLSTRTGTSGWDSQAKVGKTLVSSSLIDRVVAAHQATLYEVPVGFKWFVEGLHTGDLCFGGEESAGASLLTRNGKPWSTDKDGIAVCLLAAEITAVTGHSIDDRYRQLTTQHGDPAYTRVDTPATPETKEALSTLNPDHITDTFLAGDPITEVATQAAGNGAAIGGIKVSSEHAWFAARPSGTENVTKMYAESFRGKDHLHEVLEAAQAIVDRALQ